MGSSIIRNLWNFEICYPQRAIQCKQKFRISGQPGFKLGGIEALANMLIETHGPSTVIIHAGASDIRTLY